MLLPLLPNTVGLVYANANDITDFKTTIRPKAITHCRLNLITQVTGFGLGLGQRFFKFCEDKISEVVTKMG
jgi:hypothetical protein